MSQHDQQPGTGEGLGGPRSASEAFPTIESAHDYLSLLGEAVENARKEVAAEVKAALRSADSRRTQGYQLAAHCLARLDEHLGASRRALNDLRSLRRLLQGERQSRANKTSEAAP